MTAKTTVLSLSAGLFLLATAVSAHHSLVAEFDLTKPVTLKGVLTRMEWVNPHGWIYVDVPNPDGTVANWAVEAGSPTSLLRRGLRKTDFPPGIEVVVEGFRAKSGGTRANGRTVTFKDGRNFFLGPADTGAADAR